jgi:hypothetical protein
VTFDLERYRRRAERFAEELSREYYLHLAGHKAELEIEPIYSEYADLFTRDAVAKLREVADSATADDERRRLRYLLHFAFDGLVGAETKSESAELAGLEASLEVDPGDGPVPYRAVSIEQQNEPDPERRAALERAQNAVLDERLNPLHRAMLERAHRLCEEFGWPSYAAAYAELRGIDLESLARQTERFLAATEDAYSPAVDPRLAAAEVPPLGELRRSDLARFFRAADLDGSYPAERLIEAFSTTLAGMGMDLSKQANVRLDTEPRPTKSPRAFCSTPRVPEEVYLVIAPSGGRDDYAALFHEGGHTEHYSQTSPELAFEYRHLGDNTVTESFAFLLENLVSTPEWLHDRLGIEDAEAAVAHARAVRLVMLRRYSAKLAYELELHGSPPSLEAMRERYSSLLSSAIRVGWPQASWLADVDEGFYAACYLRAWALETRWRAELCERFGERWFSSPAAGDWLRSLWSAGQSLDGHELLAETVGGELDFAELAAAFV